ncbi:MAG: maleylpyruvate isomerase N-terminal domain-containing protein, partial [Streptosporangiaceae bacterium]
MRSGATALLAGAISYALGACAVIAPREMSLPTPCGQWDLGTLLGHLRESMADLEEALRTGRLGASQPAPPPPVTAPGDPVEEIRDCAAELLWACYGASAAEFVVVGGLPVSSGVVACTGAIEIAVHGWDVSAARGRDCPI